MENGFFSKVFTEVVQTLGLKQGEVAQKLELDQSTVSKLMNGERLPTYEQVQKIIDVFGVNPQRLFQWGA